MERVPASASGPMIYQLIYSSSAASLFGQDDLGGILTASRRNNAAADVTGALLYGSGNFMQILEGPNDRVAEVYRRIETDPRHHNATVFLNDPVGERLFPDCPMAYYHLEGRTKQEHRRNRDLFDPGVPDRQRARILRQTLATLAQRDAGAEPARVYPLRRSA